MLTALSVPSYPQTVGVAEGDYFTYVPEYVAIYNGSGFTWPYQLSNFSYMADVESVNRTVTDVTGSVVTFEEDIAFNNGSATQTNTVVVDVSDPNAQGALSIPIIDADAEVGDQVANDNRWLNDLMYITSTFTWGFPTPRECNYHESMTTTYATVNRTFWWDQTTGILVQHWVTVSYTSGTNSAFGSYKLTITATNRWAIPEFPTGTVMLLMFVAVAASMEIYRRKKLNLVS